MTLAGTWCTGKVNPPHSFKLEGYLGQSVQTPLGPKHTPELILL